LALASKTKSKLAELLLVLGEEELTVEKARQRLADCSSFEPYAAFTRIDRENQGSISSRQINDFLKEQGVRHLFDQECAYLVNYFQEEKGRSPNLQYSE